MWHPCDVTEAVLLVGGQGTRLRPLTINTPKPMLPVAGVPFTVHQITRARDAGVTRIVLATSYRADTFKAFIDDTDLGIEVVIATEDEPLGTGGAIRHALPFLQSSGDDPVLIFNGDVLSGVDIAGLVAHHQDTASDVTLYLTPVDDPRAYGLVPTDHTGRVTAFLEKPKTEAEIVTNNINAGCYVFKRSIIDAIPAGRVGVGGARDVPRPAGGRCPRHRRRRQGLLARPRHAAGVRPGLVRPGARRGSLAGRGRTRATSWRSRARRSPTTRRCTAAR